MRIQLSDDAPSFAALTIEENEGGCVLKIVNGQKLAPDLALDVDADDQDFIAEFSFKPVHDGFLYRAVYSIGRLEFEHDRLALADHILNRFCVAHQRRLAGVQNDP